MTRGVKGESYPGAHLHRSGQFTVEVERGDFHAALSEFIRRYQFSGITRELKLRRHFVPRSTKRKIKSLRARRRSRVRQD